MSKLSYVLFFGPFPNSNVWKAPRRKTSNFQNSNPATTQTIQSKRGKEGTKKWQTQTLITAIIGKKKDPENTSTLRLFLRKKEDDKNKQTNKVVESQVRSVRIPNEEQISPDFPIFSILFLKSPLESTDREKLYC